MVKLVINYISDDVHRKRTDLAGFKEVRYPKAQYVQEPETAGLWTDEILEKSAGAEAEGANGTFPVISQAKGQKGDIVSFFQELAFFPG